MSGVICGLVIDTLLVVNNYRDRENDKRDGKITLIVRIGEKKAEKLYLAFRSYDLSSDASPSLFWRERQSPFLYLHVHNLHTLWYLALQNSHAHEANKER